MAITLSGIKEAQQRTWASGDYARVGALLPLMSEQLCEAADVRSGQDVLDVACGHGNTAIAAARRFAGVTGIDYVPELLAAARRRADAEGLGEITFVDGDAEAIPFPDASFDVVLSTVGVMFTADHEQAAAELLRVTRPGGRIGLANWTPGGFIGELFKVVGSHVPPPPDAQPPPAWGTEQRLRELFGDGITELRIERRTQPFRFPSPEFFVEFMRTYYGPTLKAFGTLGEAGQTQLATDIEDLVRRFNTADDGTVVIHAEYLEVVATRR